MIYLLERNQIIFHSVNKSEMHPALSGIAKFISLSIYGHDGHLAIGHVTWNISKTRVGPLVL